MRSSIPTFLLAMLTCHAAIPSSWDALFPASNATPQVLAPDVFCTGDDESHASVFPDGHTLYFLKNTPSFDFYTIVSSERATESGAGRRLRRSPAAIQTLTSCSPRTVAALTSCRRAR